MIFVCIFIALFLAFLLFRGVINRWALYAITPLLSLKNSATSFLTNELAVLKEKKSLAEENFFLKNKLVELEIKTAVLEDLRKENEKLKGVFSQNKESSLIAASIISRYGYRDYDSLIIDAGLNQGAKEGMPVTAYGEVLLGYIAEIAPSSSRVKFISFPGEETSIFIDDSVSAIAVGAGGENLEIMLPRGVEVKIGSRIKSLENSLLLGFAEKIAGEPADPFQKILLRLPVNIHELRQVYLLKREK